MDEDRKNIGPNIFMATHTAENITHFVCDMFDA